MTDTYKENLNLAIASTISEKIGDIELGGLLRINGCTIEQAIWFCRYLNNQAKPFLEIKYLTEEPGLEFGVNADEATEIRNNPDKALMLFVPINNNNVIETLGNAFNELEYKSILQELFESLTGRLLEMPDTGKRNLIGRINESTPRELQIEFLLRLSDAESSDTLGKYLWQIGLIPDLGSDFASRLNQNSKVVKAISKPARTPTATLSSRLDAAGVLDRHFRNQLLLFLERQPLVAESYKWTKAVLAENFPTFDEWPFTHYQNMEIERLEVLPFIRPDQSLDRSCKLKERLDSDSRPTGALFCEVSETASAKVQIKWALRPSYIQHLSSWVIDVVAPKDMRTSDGQILTSRKLKADPNNNKALITIDFNADILDSYRKFVLRLRPVDENGAFFVDANGEVVEADSQEFEIDIIDSLESPESLRRQANARSFQEARLIAAVESEINSTPGPATYNPDEQTLSVVFGSKYQARINLPSTIFNLQRQIIGSSKIIGKFRSSVSINLGFQDHHIEHIIFEGDVTSTFQDKRSKFFQYLAENPILGVPESFVWNDESLAAAKAYVKAYFSLLDKLDSSQGDEFRLIDSLTLDVEGSFGEVTTAVLLLPIHPMRLVWILKYYEKLQTWINEVELVPLGARKTKIDTELVKQITPSNFPFCIYSTETQETLTYCDELSFGTGIYMSEAYSHKESLLNTIYKSFGLGRQGVDFEKTKQILSNKIDSYITSHSGANGVKIAAVDNQDGAVLVDAIRRQILSVDDTEGMNLSDIRIILNHFADDLANSASVQAIIDFQNEIKSHSSGIPRNLLRRQFEYQIENLDKYFEHNEGFHLSVLSPPCVSNIVHVKDFATRIAPVDGLISPTTCALSQAKEGMEYTIFPALGRQANGNESELSIYHASYIRRSNNLDAGAKSYPVMRVTLDEINTSLINAVHAQSDWVISIDKRLGSSIYASAAQSPVTSPYLLDCSPDYFDGIGSQVSVTTTHRHEVKRILRRAMDELDLSASDIEAVEVLENLATISGQLALRLIQDNSLAKESVSLAALVMHLKQEGRLVDKIIIPLDAHKSLFNSSNLTSTGIGRRCDLLLVQMNQRSFSIEAVEVKYRKQQFRPESLLDDIVQQIDATIESLGRLIFDKDEPRIDNELQWARFANLLHFYADKSAQNGFISMEKIEEVHRSIDRCLSDRTVPKFSRAGYVIALGDPEGLKTRKNDVPIIVLGGDDLQRVGLTTTLMSQVMKPDSQVIEREAGGIGIIAVENAEEWPIEESMPVEDVKSEVELGSCDLADASQTDIEIQNSTLTAEHGKPDLFLDETKFPKSHIEVVLGTNRFQEKVPWRVSTTGSPHAFIVGIPGQGKSVTLQKIIHDFADSRVPSLVFDFHGDLAGSPPDGARVIDVGRNGLPFSPFEVSDSRTSEINFSAFEIAEILQVIYTLGPVQQKRVYDALKQSYANNGWLGKIRGNALPTISELVMEIEKLEAQDRSASVLPRLLPFYDFNVFAEDAKEWFNPIDSDCLVIDVSGLDNEQTQITAASFLIRKIYNEMSSWPQNGQMKLLLALDEAHKYAKDKTLPKIMKEGRKFGISVVLATQSIEDFPPQVIQNVGTKVVFRTNAPTSKKTAAMLGYSTAENLIASIENLNVGEAFVRTPEMLRADKVYMSMRSIIRAPE